MASFTRCAGNINIYLNVDDYWMLGHVRADCFDAGALFLSLVPCIVFPMLLWKRTVAVQLTAFLSILIWLVLKPNNYYYLLPGLFQYKQDFLKWKGISSLSIFVTRSVSVVMSIILWKSGILKFQDISKDWNTRFGYFSLKVIRKPV